MGLTYQVGKGWNLSPEKTDYNTNYNTNRPINYVREESDWEQYRYRG